MNDVGRGRGRGGGTRPAINKGAGRGRRGRPPLNQSTSVDARDVSIRKISRID